MGVPFTLREPVIKQLGFKFENDFVLIPMTLNLCSTFKDALFYQKIVMDAMKKSLLPIGLVFFRRIAQYCLPERIMKRASFRFANKLTLVMSNVPGPTNTFKFSGKKILKTMFLVGGSADMTTTISYFSINGVIK
jgi:hypothetical protein